jgi:hypothetical protein
MAARKVPLGASNAAGEPGAWAWTQPNVATHTTTQLRKKRRTKRKLEMDVMGRG